MSSLHLPQTGEKMACIVFVEFTVKEQAVDQVNDLMTSQDGLPTTRSQKRMFIS